MRPEEVDTSVIQSDLGGRSEPDCAEPAAENRALIALSRATHRSERTGGYHHAPVLAQLVATKDQHPQTRERRRAEASVVLAAYRATAALRAA
jgi:hypothetical protein